MTAVMGARTVVRNALTDVMMPRCSTDCTGGTSAFMSSPSPADKLAGCESACYHPRLPGRLLDRYRARAYERQQRLPSSTPGLSGSHDSRPSGGHHGGWRGSTCRLDATLQVRELACLHDPVGWLEEEKAEDRLQPPWPQGPVAAHDEAGAVLREVAQQEAPEGERGERRTRS